uniref:Uncharacterized protein n=1 Tax=Cucumis sativus TaxID=3659 RepID=A0A0A0KB61_CUCSA
MKGESRDCKNEKEAEEKNRTCKIPNGSPPRVIESVVCGWRFLVIFFAFLNCLLSTEDIVNDQFSWDVSPELEIQWLLK